jgi:protein-tyrosine kinase
MSKIYEALQNAQQESVNPEKQEAARTKEIIQDVRQEVVKTDKHKAVPAKTTAMTLLPSPVELDLENEMVTLYQNIEALLSGIEKRTIEFIGSRSGEGTSTIIREFARVAAKKLDKSVFLLDVGRHNQKQCVYFHITPDSGWEEVAGEGVLNGEFARISEMDVEVCPNSNSLPKTPNFYSPQITSFWDSLRKSYDLVLIDAPPAEESPDGIEIARRVDGVVLVVEAEKTRWQVVDNLKGKIEHCGGNILGVVINKRRFYIPENIYRRF